jgi:hypothetical protein
MNKMRLIALTGLVASLVASSAGAAVLTFDGLAEMAVYGNTGALPANMHYDGKHLAYQEAGFQLTLNAPNAVPGEAHIGDGTFEPQTYNWHDGMENGAASYATLTRIGGGLFNVASFDYYTDGSALSADGKALGFLEGAGSWDTALTGISELRLDAGYFNQIDNLSVEAADGAVPLPGTLPLLLGGLAAAVLARRRQQ